MLKPRVVAFFCAVFHAAVGGAVTLYITDGTWVQLDKRGSWLTALGPPSATSNGIPRVAHRNLPFCAPLGTDAARACYLLDADEGPWARVLVLTVCIV